MKRFLVALLMAAMTVTAVTGCGSKGGDSAKSDSPSGAAADAGTEKKDDTAAADNSGAASSGESADITLKVWCPQNQVDTGIMDEQQKAFAAEHPEYNITWVTEVVGEDKCQESVLKDVGAAADVFLFASDQLSRSRRNRKAWGSHRRDGKEHHRGIRCSHSHGGRCTVCDSFYP